MTRVDVLLDGRVWLVNQNPLNPHVIYRIHQKRKHGHKVTTKPHVIPPPKPVPPPAPPPTPVNLHHVQNVLFFATATGDMITEALTLPPRWKYAFSADPNYQPSAEQIARCIHAGRDVYAWCDCNTTLPEQAKQMVYQHGLSDWYGQGENDQEFDIAVQGGAKAAIVNISALRPDQCLMVDRCDVLVTNENYRNKNPGERPNWKGLAGVGSNAGAVYASITEGAIYTPVSVQIRNSWFGHQDCWYTENFMPEDWQALRDLG